jgi:hypothetical protein
LIRGHMLLRYAPVDIGHLTHIDAAQHSGVRLQCRACREAPSIPLIWDCLGACLCSAHNGPWCAGPAFLMTTARAAATARAVAAAASEMPVEPGRSKRTRHSGQRRALLGQPLRRAASAGTCCEVPLLMLPSGARADIGQMTDVRRRFRGGRPAARDPAPALHDGKNGIVPAPPTLILLYERVTAA